MKTTYWTVVSRCVETGSVVLSLHDSFNDAMQYAIWVFEYDAFYLKWEAYIVQGNYLYD